MTLPTDIWSIIDEYTDENTKRNLRLTSHLVKLTVKVKSAHIKQKTSHRLKVHESFPYLENLTVTYFNGQYIGNILIQNVLENLTIIYNKKSYDSIVRLSIKAKHVTVLDDPDYDNRWMEIGPFRNVYKSFHLKTTCFIATWSTVAYDACFVVRTHEPNLVIPQGIHLVNNRRFVMQDVHNLKMTVL